jgi:hypothetical protein
VYLLLGVAAAKAPKWHYTLFFERYAIIFFVPPGVADILKMP